MHDVSVSPLYVFVKAEYTLCVPWRGLLRYHLLKNYLANTKGLMMEKRPTTPPQSRVARYADKRFGLSRIIDRAKRLQPRDLSGRLARMLKGK